jgi:hypothetical protein
MTNRRFQYLLWSLGTLTLVATAAVWVQMRLGKGELSLYDIFPLLGLTAFGLMWSHYIAGALRRYFILPREASELYVKITGWAILILILLHPSLFFVQLWLDGLGLPPQSYLEVYTTGVARISLLLGTVSLLAFLAFELHRIFKKAKWWPIVEYVNITAMLAIFYHGIILGGELNIEWFRLVWMFYLVTFIGAVVYNQIQRREEI